MTTVTNEPASTKEAETLSKSDLDKLLEMPVRFTKLKEITDRCSESSLAGMDSMTRSYTLAKGVEVMRQLLNKEVMQTFMNLMDTGLGFRTDHGPGCLDSNKRQHQPYTVDVVRECCIDAFIHGLHVTGNKFNIIAKRMYITKEGFTHKIKGIASVTNVKVSLAPPKILSEGALVAAQMEWMQDGVKQVCWRDIPVRVNSFMGADAILGKAERKIKAAAYAQMTGSDPLPEGEVDEALQSPEPEAVKTPLLERVKQATQTPVEENLEDWERLVQDLARANDWKDRGAKNYLDSISQRQHKTHIEHLNTVDLAMLRAQVMPLVAEYKEADANTEQAAPN